MPAAEAKIAKVYNRQPRTLDADVYTLACERTARIMDSFDHVAVFFSGGKDSAATLNVALEVAHSDPRFERHLPLRTMFFDEEAIPYETEQYVRRVFSRPDVAGEWYCMPIRHRNACSRKSPWWWPWAPEAEALWCRPMPSEAITTVPGFPVTPASARLSNPDANGLFFNPSLGNCAVLMGIRALESMNRRRSVLQAHEDGSNYVVHYEGPTSRGNLWKAYPVYDWTVADVWTAPARFGWDYNTAYDRLEMAGVSPSVARCSPAFGEQPLQKIHTYAECFPEVWDKMVDRVPGVGAAYRYALTELYCYRDIPEKPAGLPWSEFIQHYITKHDKASTQHIANRIRQEMKRHYRFADVPIVGNAAYPMSGVSWRFLLQLAMRGDLKRRNTPQEKMSNDAMGRPAPRAWHRYATELAATIASGTFGELGYPGTPPADPWSLVPDYARLEDPSCAP